MPIDENNEMNKGMTDFAREGLVRGNRVWNEGGKRGLLDISRSSFLTKVRTGRLPIKPIKLGERTTVYSLAEVLAVVRGEAL